MTERPSKAARVAKLQCIGINTARLAKLLADLSRDPAILDRPPDRYAIGRMERAAYSNVIEHEKLPMVNTDFGNPFDWALTSLPAYMKRLVDTSPAFKDLMSDLWSRSPCTPTAPWRLLFNFDEATPGMVLRQDNKRKS